MKPWLRKLLNKGARRVERTTSIAPGRYGELIERYVKLRPRSAIEVGVWRGDRGVLFLQLNPELEEYVGFDLFENMTTDQHVSESMGKCYAEKYETVFSRLTAARHQGTRVQLERGNTHVTLPAFATTARPIYDFAFIDGGHSLETIENDWRCIEHVLSATGTCIFDDYYLERDDIGAKRLIDGLDSALWCKDFFGLIDKTEFANYITMVAVSRRDQQRA
jgi:hypothetical protein